jgi:hypothetical protein
MVICESHGGSNTATTLYVFEIGRQFRHLSTTDVYDWEFRDVDGDSFPELITSDDYGYWPRSRAESPRPKVVLRFRDGRYRADSALLRRPASEFWDYSNMALRIARDTDWDIVAEFPKRLPPPALCRYMIDLIYAGQSDLASRFLDLAWPPNLRGKDAFLAEMSARLAGSPYWDAVKAVNFPRPPVSPEPSVPP